nr:unnamed protein product [Callosobruchus analis]
MPEVRPVLELKGDTASHYLTDNTSIFPTLLTKTASWLKDPISPPHHQYLKKSEGPLSRT